MKAIPRAWLVAAGLVLLAGAAVVALSLGHAHEWADHLEDALEQRGLATGLSLFAGATIVGTLLLVPAWIFPIAAGAAFGFGWGFAAAMVAQGVAAQCAFLLTRYVLRKRMEKVARRNKSFVSVDRAVKHQPWKVVALLRVAPVLPSGLKSYFLGLTCVKPLDYATASAVGVLPATALKVYIGDAGRGALSGGGPMQWAVLAAGTIATVVLVLFVGRVARRTLGF